MPKLTLLIFSRNDVRQALQLTEEMYSVADEVVLVDQSDAQEKARLRKEEGRYAKKLRVFDAFALGYSEPLRAYAHRRCTNEWVLRLDTDERITDALKRDIKRIIARAGCNAFAIRVHDIIDGKRAPFFAWQVQLYKKSRITFRGMLHEQPTVEGNVCKLEEPDYYIEHRTEMRHTARKDYDLMRRYERLSYAMYNKEVLNDLAKLMAWHSGRQENSRLGRLITGVLLAYERITGKGQDEELSNFDYFMHFVSIHVVYSVIEKDLRSLLMTLPVSLSHVKRIEREKRARKSNFEIAKRLSETGIIRFLELDRPEVVDGLTKKYRGKEQGMRLLVKLIEEKYKGLRASEKYKNVVVSPHIDDAFLSLGGLLWGDRRRPQLILDVFSKSRFSITGKDAGLGELVKTRKAEEKRNVEKIGARVVFLPFSDTAVEDPTRDRRLVHAVRKSIEGYAAKGARVFFPLGMGSNGGHVLVSRLGLEIARDARSDNIYFYEDLPYAVRTSKLFPLARSFVGAENRKTFPFINTRLDKEKLEETYFAFPCREKLEMCKEYKSQVDGKVLLAVEAYSRMLGCRERVWKVRDTAYIKGLLK